MSVVFCSFWAENMGGRLVRRLNSRKHPARSIMLNAQRVSLLVRARVLNPDDLLLSKQQLNFVSRFNTHPTYLSNCPQFNSKSSSVIRNPLSPRERNHLDTFLDENDIMIIDDDGLTFLDRFELNGLQVRTRASELKVKTCDSIVAGRFASANANESADFSDSEGGDNMFFGQVTHILKIDDDVFVKVAWFKQTDRDMVISMNQRQGLTAVRMRLRRRDHVWMHAAHLILQQHYLVGTVSASHDFFVIVKV